jgi:hypothetical protein
LDEHTGSIFRAEVNMVSQPIRPILTSFLEVFPLSDFVQCPGFIFYPFLFVPFLLLESVSLLGERTLLAGPNKLGIFLAFPVSNPEKAGLKGH